MYIVQPPLIESLLTIQNLKVFFGFFFPPSSKIQKKTQIQIQIQIQKIIFQMTNTKDKKITSHFPLGSGLPILRFVVHFPKCAIVQMCKCANVTCKKLNMT